MTTQNKAGRPGLSYAKFSEVWEQLLEDGRATAKTANEILGGSRSTIVAFRERYEREKSAKEMSIIKEVELSQAVQQAIAGIKVKEIIILEKENQLLKGRIDEYTQTIQDMEKKHLETATALEEAKSHFEKETLKYEKELSASKALYQDGKQTEEKLLKQYEQLSEQYNQAKQEAAVAKKEIEMLREPPKLNIK